MNITRIFDEFEKGNICIFNTEGEARHSLIEYAKRNKSIEKRYAISIDTFKSYFVAIDPNLIEVTSIMRLLFVKEFLRSNTLSYLISNEFPESLDRLSSYVSKILPSLKRVKDCSAYSMIDNAMISDIELLYSEYNNFLDKRNLYEPSYNEYRIENADSSIMSNKYSIIASDTIKDLNLFLDCIKRPSNITLINSLDDVNKVYLETFANSAEEESIQLRRIAYLLNEGVNTYDIAITLSDFNNQIDDIKREARKYNIPLSHKSVTLLKNYSECRYFYGLKNLFDERFSLSTMKDFFLDYGFDFKDRLFKQQLIRVGIDANINHGQADNSFDTWCNRLNPKNCRTSQVELYTKLLDFYKEFKKYVVLLNTAKTREDVEIYLSSLENLLLNDYEDGRIQSETYNKVIDEFNKYYDSMAACKIEIQDNLFSNVLQSICDVKYESAINKNEDGIQIYSYPESGTLNYKYHFILGMNHVASETINKPLDILPPYIDEEYREEENLTYAIINNYITNSCNTYISYGTENYDGSQLPPSFFIERNLSSNDRLNLPLISNPYKDEELFFAGEKEIFKPVILQTLGFNSADSTMFTKKTLNMADSNIENKGLIEEFLNVCSNEEGQIKLSSTSIDTFKKCPFKWALQYIMKINDKDFDIVPIDHREVGTFLHRVMEVFFKKIKLEDKRFFSSNIEKYTQLLSQVFDDELINYSQGNKSPTPSSLIYIEDSFKNKVMQILQNECDNFDGLESYGFEKSLEYSGVIEGESFSIPYHMRGLIDRVVTLEDQGFAVIDYKKSSATVKEKAFRKGIEETGELKSYQFPCYRVLMTNNGMEVKSAAYYGFNDGKYEFVFKDDEDFLLKIDEIFNNVLKDMLLSVKSGNFKTTPSKLNCASCYFRQICRKRYSTK